MKYGLIRLFTFIFLFFPFQDYLLPSENNKNNTLNLTLSNIKNDIYILGPGDSLSIVFLGAEELSSTYKILSDGNIQLPLVGTQSITGLTLNEAKTKLVELFSNELIKPEINLSLLSMRPIKVSLIGEVNRPGIYSLTEGESSRVLGATQSISSRGYPTVVDAIQKAGGLTLEADISNLTLFRELSGKEKKFKKVELDLLSMIKTGDQTFNPNLFDGDIIKIPKLANTKTSIEDIPNNLIPEKIKIYVVGEVERPGMYEVSINTSLDKAVLIAGGPIDWKYKKNNVQLLRVKRNGKVEVKKLSLKDQKLASYNKKTSLRDGDIIKINRNLFGKTSNALRTFLPPIRDMYSLYGVYKLIED